MTKLTGLKITKSLLLIFFGVILLHLGGLGREEATFFSVFSAWTCWFWIITLMDMGEFFPPMTTVQSYLKGVFVSLCCGFLAAIIPLLFCKIF